MQAHHANRNLSVAARPRVFLDRTLAAGARCTLDAATSHHLSTVLRRRRGSDVTLFNGDGKDYLARIAEVGRCLELTVESATINRSESPLASTLIQGISRADRMDTTIRMSVELGVNRILPAYTRHAIAALNPGRASRKLAHWQAIAVSAAEQCGRAQVPVVAAPASLSDVLSQTASEQGLDERLLLNPRTGDTLTLRATGCRAVMLLAGPESGLTAGEIEHALQAGFRSVTLGPRVLRTETAAPAALAILQARHGDMGPRE